MLKNTTDNNGQKSEFKYDGFQRLKESSSRDGGLFMTYDYAYELQNGGSPNYIKVFTSENNLTSFQYIDGLGREMQSVAQAYSPDHKDVINAMTYDAFGRVHKSYLPIEGGSSGAYVDPTGPNVTNMYEASPLNRVITQVQPDFSKVKTGYGANSSADQVKKYPSGVYPSGSLYKVDQTDENGNTTSTFKDKIGRLILTRKYTKNGETVDTYYGYDDRGNLERVASPEAESFEDDEHCYFYTYDKRNRLKNKKIPGTLTKTKYTYNNRDEIVETKDPNGNIITNKYDEYGRPTESKLGGTVISSTTYDTAPGASIGQIASSTVNNLANNSPLTTTFSYDDFGRVIGTNSASHIGSDDMTTAYVGATNRIESTSRTHAGHENLSIAQRYQYDHVARLKETYHSVNGSSNEILLSHLGYNYRDELIEKNLNKFGNSYLQSIDYKYNIRGWLTHINEVGLNGNTISMKDGCDAYEGGGTTVQNPCGTKEITLQELLDIRFEEDDLNVNCYSDCASCIDEARIEPEKTCGDLVEQVCGCDRKTYMNQCFAEKAGVTSWQKGPCTRGDILTDIDLSETSQEDQQRSIELLRESAAIIITETLTFPSSLYQVRLSAGAEKIVLYDELPLIIGSYEVLHSKEITSLDQLLEINNDNVIVEASVEEVLSLRTSDRKITFSSSSTSGKPQCGEEVLIQRVIYQYNPEDSLFINNWNLSLPLDTSILDEIKVVSYSVDIIVDKEPGRTFTAPSFSLNDGSQDILLNDGQLSVEVPRACLHTLTPDSIPSFEQIFNMEMNMLNVVETNGWRLVSATLNVTFELICDEINDCNTETPSCTEGIALKQQQSVANLMNQEEVIDLEAIEYPTKLIRIILCDGSEIYVLKDELAQIEGNYTIVQQIVVNSADQTFLVGSANDADHNDLFALQLYYSTPNDMLQAPAQRNGNISSMKWQARGREVQAYGFQYDQLDRLTNAHYADISAATGTTTHNRYTVSKIAYDLNGNILGLNRRGVTTKMPCIDGFNWGGIDELTYNYVGNRLLGVQDAIADPIAKLEGFKPKENVGTQQYGYDNAGNLISDANKGISIDYNHLNLPKKVIFEDGKEIEWWYDAAGSKLRKISRDGDTEIVKDYVGGIEYSNETLEAIYHDEGRVVPNEEATNQFHYEYTLSDHLGNSRITFSDRNQDGIIQTEGENLEVLQESHYYPFGLQMPKRNANNQNYRYGFNGKEKDDSGEWGSNTNYDYGFRIYNPAIGKFLSVDPLTQKYAMLTPYQFASNTPIASIDLDGLESYYAANGEYLGKYGKSTEIRVITDPTALNSNYKMILKPENQKNYDPIIFDTYLPSHSEKAYTDPDQAALDWAYKYNGKSHLDNERASFEEWKVNKGRDRKEYGAAIGSKTTTDGNGGIITLYVIGETVSDEKAEADILGSKILEGWNRSHGVHTHPIRGGGDGEDFSGFKDDLMPWLTGDKHLAKNNKLHLYLATPKGILKLYNYEKDEVDIIDRDLPHHPFSDTNKKKPSLSINNKIYGPKRYHQIEYEAPKLKEKKD